MPKGVYKRLPHTEESKLKNSIAQKKFYEEHPEAKELVGLSRILYWQSDEKRLQQSLLRQLYFKEHPEAKEKIRQDKLDKKLSEDICNNISRGKKGKKQTPEHRKNNSRSHKGIQALDKNPNWQGGKSFELYSLEWTEALREAIRQRDNYQCQKCLKFQTELKRKLHVHHIDENKQNCSEENLISFCQSCHMRGHRNKQQAMERIFGKTIEKVNVDISEIDKLLKGGRQVG